ncbi:MAG: diaminopimelate decarboxylase [Ignavibacteriales bacterium]|nr:diaminopimelate decarboxylase [Ignavibacteriales bacterium]
MRYFDSSYFTYKNNQLFCEDVAVEQIIKQVGTPTYIYSKKFFIDRYTEFTNAFKEIKHSIFYAIKSNFNLNLIKIFSNLGSGLDVNSEGELYRALKVGIHPQKIFLSGVGKTKREIELGIENNILLIKTESEEELILIDKIAREKNKIAPVHLRINPNVDPKTHPYISTGLAEEKFGIPEEEAIEHFRLAAKLENVRPVGVGMHIGSQITTIAPYKEAIEKMLELFLKIKSAGIKLNHFNIGGGIGVVYNDEKPFTLQEFANKVIPIFKKFECEIMFEPGRFLTANGGIIATEVLYTKQNKKKNFIIVDASMAEIIRPSIYDAYHHIQHLVKIENETIIADIVGPVCESGDFIAKDREIIKCNSGEFLAIMSAGSYCMVMSSNYNGRRRAPEIMVDKDKFYITRSRESFQHLLFDEQIIEELFQ